MEKENFDIPLEDESPREARTKETYRIRDQEQVVSSLAKKPFVSPSAPTPSEPMSRQPNPPKDGSKVLLILVLVFSILSICALAFLFYYVAVQNSRLPQFPDVSYVRNISPSSNGAEAGQTQGFQTEVINFQVPQKLPADVKDGSCWINSIAQPYREDAWRCAVGQTVFDPCLETGDEGLVFCQMNPLDPSASFTIRLTSPLPTLQVAVTPKVNWAWFVVLSDGTVCAPYTDNRPAVGEEEGLYGCKSQNSQEQVILIGDLVAGDVWTAQKIVAEQRGIVLVEKSRETVEIQKVWQ